MRRSLRALMLGLLLGGCAATGPSVSAGANAGANAVVEAPAWPDLRGTWTGTWAGTPASLVVTEQSETGREGLYVGPWTLFGRKAPGVFGVLTSTVRGRTVSVAASGVVTAAPNAVSVRVYAQTTFGDQDLTLRTDGPDRLVGTGDSPFGPNGPVTLTRVR